MYQHSRLNSDLNFFQKIKNLDFILLFCIIILSTLSFFIMYSTDGGELLYHSKSHLTKLITFFILMLIISFFNICNQIITLNISWRTCTKFHNIHRCANKSFTILIYYFSWNRKLTMSKRREEKTSNKKNIFK